MLSKLFKMFAVVLFATGLTACADDPALVPVDTDDQPTVKDISLMVNRNLTQLMSSLYFSKEISETTKPRLYVGEVTSSVDFTNVKADVVRDQIYKRLDMLDRFILVNDKAKPHDYELTASFIMHPTKVSVNYDYRTLLFEIDFLNVYNKENTVMTEMLRRHRGTGLWE